MIGKRMPCSSYRPIVIELFQQPSPSLDLVKECDFWRINFMSSFGRWHEPSWNPGPTVQTALH